MNEFLVNYKVKGEILGEVVEANNPIEAVRKIKHHKFELLNVGLYLNGDFIRECYVGREQWKTSLVKDFVVGDLVKEEVVEEMINVLPPTTNNHSMVQMGEPYDHVTVEGKEYPLVETVIKRSGYWIWQGICLPNKNRGETLEFIEKAIPPQ